MDLIEANGDTQETIAKMADVIQTMDQLFQDLAVDCENFDNGGCLAHGDNCMSLACPLAED